MQTIRASGAGDVVREAASTPYRAPREIRGARPAPRRSDCHDALGDARRRVRAAGQWTANQLMGRRWPIGCVALEITQRCNLDCAACYLSEHSQAVHDVPLEELFRR